MSGSWQRIGIESGKQIQALLVLVHRVTAQAYVAQSIGLPLNIT